MSAEREDSRGSDDGRFGLPADDCCRDAREDFDHLLRADAGVDDPVRLQLMFDRDEAEYEMTRACEVACAAADRPPPSTPDEFAAEFIDSGPDRAATMLGSMEPGPETAAMLAMLRPAVLMPSSMVSVVAATEKLLSWVQARQHRWIAAFACPDVVAPRRALQRYASQPGQPLHPKPTARSGNRDSVRVDASEYESENGLSGSAVYGDPDVDAVLTEVALNVAAAEIGAALHFTPVTSKRRVCQAVDYAVELPATLTAMEAGKIDRGRAGVIAERTQNLPVELRRRVERSVLPKATSRTTGQVRGIVDRAVISVDPEAAQKRHKRAIAQRSVAYRAAEDGIGVFRAELAADKAQVAYSVIDQIADQLHRAPAEGSDIDHRGIGALRADVFGDLFDQLACTGTITLHDTFMRRATGDFEASSSPKPNRSNNSAAGKGSSSVADWDSIVRDGSPDSTGPAQGGVVDVGGSDGKADDGGVVGDGSAGAGGGVVDAGGFADDVGGGGVVADRCGAAEDAAVGVGMSAGDVSDAGVVADRCGAADDAAVDVCGSTGDGHASWEVAPAGADSEGARSEVEGFAQDMHNSLAQRGGTGAEGCPKSTKVVPVPNGDDIITGKQWNFPLSPSLPEPKNENYRHLGTHHGRHTHLNVTIAESTLAGRDDRPGELEGHGPIPADLARAIAISAETITAIAIRPGCGTGLDLGRTTYRPRLAQRDHVTTRDQTCRFPGCRRAAKRCQIDHSDEFCPGRKDGGVTCPCNLSCLCAFHHGLKTGGLWDSVQHSDASITWTSPTGRQYTTRPRQWPTEHDDERISEATSAVSSDRNVGAEELAVGSGSGDPETIASVSSEVIPKSGASAVTDFVGIEADDEPPF